MDECAFPILLADALRREGQLPLDALTTFIAMIERAASFLVRNGPVTGEDRWEEDAGYSPFTLAVEIAALLASADMLEACGKRRRRPLSARDRRCLERTGRALDLCHRHRDVRAARGEGLLRPHRASRPSPTRLRRRTASCRSRTGRPATSTSRRRRSSARTRWRWSASASGPPTIRVLSTRSRSSTPSCAAICRRGPSGIATAATAMASTPTARLSTGPARAGRGRCSSANARITSWPPAAATGPRACWRRSKEVAGVGGLLPEQVWDGADMPERELRRGGPSGSAMPLVWAHSEHIKLLRSLRDGRVFDMPPQGVERYIKGKTGSSIRSWRFNNKIRSMPSGKILRVEVLALGGRALEHRRGDDLSMTAETSQNAFRHSCRGSAGRRYAAGRNRCVHLLLARRRPLGE